MIAGHAASPTTSPLCSRRPAILGETSTRRNVDPAHLHLGEVGRENGRVVTAGLYGWTAVVTGTGQSIAEARRAAYGRAGQVRCANMRYRLDIGYKLIAGDLERLRAWGWLG